MIFDILKVVLILLCAGGLVGYPFTIYFDSSRFNRLLISPILGLSIFGVISFLFFTFLPFNRLNLLFIWLLVASSSWFLFRDNNKNVGEDISLSKSWIVVAILISIIPAYVVSPQFIHHKGLGFYESIYDHVKFVFIDSMVRTGIPAKNPFAVSSGSFSYLNYYYGWYFLGAEAALLGKVSGWKVDIAFTGLTAFFSLLCIGWASLKLSKRQEAPWLVFLFCFVSPLLPIFVFIGGARANRLVNNIHGFEDWLRLSLWVPQHMFSGVVAIFSLLAFSKILILRKIDLRLASLTGFFIAWSYSTSVWVAVVGLFPVLISVFLIKTKEMRGISKFFNIFIVCIVTFTVSLPFILIQSKRLSSKPIIARWLFPVFPETDGIQNELLNFFGYWGYFLIICFGPLYVLTLVWLWRKFQKKEMKLFYNQCLFLAFILPLFMAEIFHSVILNNDLGWRCIIVSLFIMMIISPSAVLEIRGFRSFNILRYLLIVPSLIAGLSYCFLVALSLHFYQYPDAGSIRFETEDRKMWTAVSSVTPLTETVANNPYYEAGNVNPGGANTSWAVFSNRSSCTPSKDFISAYVVGLSDSERHFFSDFVYRVFNKSATNADFRMLRDIYHCDTLLVVSTDQLWNLSVTLPTPYFSLVKEEKGLWRIYRAVR